MQMFPNKIPLDWEGHKLETFVLEPKNRGGGDEKGRVGEEENSANFHRPESWK